MSALTSRSAPPLTSPLASDDHALAPSLGHEPGRRLAASFPRLSPPASADAPASRHLRTGIAPDDASRSSHRSRLTVTWLGIDENLRRSVADHVLAAGGDMTHDPQDAGVLVCDLAALESGVLMGFSPRGCRLLLVERHAELSGEQWKLALSYGVSGLFVLPSESSLLLDALRSEAHGRPSAHIMAVAAGHGGAGASFFAATLAGAGERNTVLVDADPYGGGLDHLVEAPPHHGATWADIRDLDESAGRALLEALPLVDGVRLLASPPRAPGLHPDTLQEALRALATTDATIIVDTASHLVGAITSYLNHLVIVSTATDHATRSVRRRRALWGLGADQCGLVIRRQGPLSPADMADLTGLPLLASYKNSSPGTVPLLDRSRWGAGRAARQLLSAEGAAS